MFDITTESSFSAAHYLREYHGPCENPHGHNWLVRATVRCREVDSIGIGIDFKVLKSHLKQVLEEFDHCDLNQIFEGKENPSSENIARRIFRRLSESIPAGQNECRVVRVEVFETPGNSTSYFE